MTNQVRQIEFPFQQRFRVWKNLILFMLFIQNTDSISCVSTRMFLFEKEYHLGKEKVFPKVWLAGIKNKTASLKSI